MAEILWDGVKPADLTSFARELAARETDTLAAVLPNRPIEGFRTRATRVSRTTTAAKVRSYDAETPIGKRPIAVQTSSVELAPIGQKLPLRESEILAKALQGGNDLAQVVASVYDDTENNVAAIANKVKLWRGEFLFSGALHIDENGFIQEADFSLAADHDLSVGDLDAAWDAGGDAIADELAWIEKVVEDTGGDRPVFAVTSSKVARTFLTSPAYLAASGTTQERLTTAQVNQIRADYGLPTLLIDDDKVGGVRVTPEDKFALATASVGEAQWGDTVEGLKLFGSKAVESVSSHAPKIVASSTLDDDPVTVWSKANATALVVAGDINGLFVAQVLAGTVES